MNRWKWLLLAVVPLAGAVGAFAFGKQYLANSFANRGNVRLLQLVVKLGADINGHSSGSCPLIEAIKSHQPSTVAYLLSERADMNVHDDTYATPLIWAIREGQIDMAKRLMAAGADLNAGDKAGWTPLRHALQTGKYDTVDMLIRAGADVNLSDNIGETPLMRAAQMGNMDILHLLLRSGANPSDRDKTGHSAIEYAENPRDPKFIVLLRRVYFVPIGDAPLDEINGLVSYFREKFDMEIKVLPPMKLDATDLDATRGQLVAENVLASMSRKYSDYGNNWSTVLIGITGQDMYPQGRPWQFCFSWGSDDFHSAVVSAARMDLHYPGEPQPDATVTNRLRKMVTKDIGVIYFWKPTNHNPKSVLYDSILGIQELDQISESF